MIIINKEISILGVTGSIGESSLKIVRNNDIKLKAITGNHNVKKLEEIAREFSPQYVGIKNEKLGQLLKNSLEDTNVNVIYGDEAIDYLAGISVDLVVNAISGVAGLMPSVCTITAGNDLAIANKETLVSAGTLITDLAKQKKVKILPIDSEHSAIWQALNGEDVRQVKKLILTCSGGPFRGKTTQQLRDVTVNEALNHPNWSMGVKISIDSATLMNKALELIEAVRLFDIDQHQIEVVVHPQSIVHSAVEYIDGSVIGQMGYPDMVTAIQYALTYPQRRRGIAKEFSLFEYNNLTFEKVDKKTFNAINLARKALSIGQSACTVFNGANEAAVELFLNGEIKFLDIQKLVEMAVENLKFDNPTNFNEVIEQDIATKKFTKEILYDRL